MQSIKGLSADHQRRLLREALAQQPTRESNLRAIADLRARHEPFPLTPIQQAYWLGRNSDFPLGGVGIHGYFEVDCVDLDVERLSWAWNRMIQRHDMMRTIVLPDGRGQIIEAPPEYRIEVEDLRGLSLSEQEHRRQAIRERMSHRVFDVTHWPLFELRAVRVDDRTTRLHYSEDAIHLDMTSSALVMDEWWQVYRDPSVVLPAFQLSYRDYALALQNARETAAHARAEAYWRERLPSLPSPPDIPRRTGAQAVHMHFVRRKLVLEPDRWRAFQRLARESDLTPSDALLALYADVIGSWSATRRFLLNVTIQNRLPLHEEVARITGDFTSFVLLDVDTSGGESFVARAQRYRDALWSDLEHRSISGVEVLRELARHRRESDLVAPFVFTSALGTSGYRGIGALGEMTYEITQTPQVLLDQQILEAEGSLVLSWDVVESAFPAGLIEAMFESQRECLLALCKSPDAWMARGPIPIPLAQRRMREEMNDTHAEFPRERLEQVFMRQAAQRGAAPAIFDEDGALSYAALDYASSELAAVLRHTLQGERIAAIAIPKSREQIVAVLAVLKAGAAYLPIDLAQPIARTERMLRAARCSVVVIDTDARLSSLPTRDESESPVLVSASGLSVVRLGNSAPSAESNAPEDASAPAYVLFTSGSTGEPKGVAISHLSVLNRMLDVVERFDISSSDRAFALTALHHDLSVFDIFGVLAVAGGAIVLPLESTERWIDQARRSDVTVWNSVPAFLSMLLAYAESRQDCTGSLPALRLALIAGDFIPRNLPERLRRIAPNASFVSLGGPTETTVWDICYPVTQLPADWDGIPYGRPMRNAHYFVLRDDLSECPDWVPGELCIAGFGLTLGYAGDDALTAERLVTHPRTGERIYRSGDLGRMRPDGLIEILGRKDRQAKLRGMRIELGEVEAALRRHPQVDRAAAWVVGEGDSARLVSAVTGDFELPPPGVRHSLADFQSSVAQGRRSARGFTNDVVSYESFGKLLSCFFDTPHGRRYPSAGARYAVEVFIVVAADRIEHLQGGLYRLDALRRELILLEENFTIDASAHAHWNIKLARESAFTLMLLANAGVLEPEYGRHARDLCLIESGYMGELAMCAAVECGLGLCPIGGLDIEHALPKDLSWMHGLLGGVPTDVSSAIQKPSEHRTADVLREFLKRELPSHMIPSQIVVVDEWPLISNGKLDRAKLEKLLVAREAPRPASPAGSSSPSSVRLRERIAGMLADILGIEHVPAHRVLHELGATSLHIVQLHAKLCAAGHRLDKVDIFRFPTVEQLADFLAGTEPVGAGQTSDPEQHQKRRREQIARLRGRRHD